MGLTIYLSGLFMNKIYNSALVVTCRQGFLIHQTTLIRVSFCFTCFKFATPSWLLTSHLSIQKSSYGECLLTRSTIQSSPSCLWKAPLTHPFTQGLLVIHSLLCTLISQTDVPHIHSLDKQTELLVSCSRLEDHHFDSKNRKNQSLT